MPITEELKNVKKFESAGFTHEQAEALAETIEQAQVQGQEGLKEFIHNEFEKQNKNIDNKFSAFDSKFISFDSKLNALEARLMTSQKDLIIKIFGIIVGTVGVAVTILKLFP